METDEREITERLARAKQGMQRLYADLRVKNEAMEEEDCDTPETRGEGARERRVEPDRQPAVMTERSWAARSAAVSEARSKCPESA